MFHFLLQKIKNKKWMAISLLIGNVLLIAIAICHPLYKQAAKDRMLADEFTTYLKTNGVNPGIYECGLTRKPSNLEEFEALRQEMTANKDVLGIPLYAQEEYLYEPASSGKYAIKRDNSGELSAQLSTLSGMEEKITIISGQMYEPGKKDGKYQAIVSETAFVELNLLMGDEITMKSVKDEEGNPVVVQVVGVFTAADNTDPYWVMGPGDFKKDLFLSHDDFFEIHMKEGDKSIILGKWFEVFDTESLRASQADRLMEKTAQLNEKVEGLYGHLKPQEYLSVLETYDAKLNRVMSSLMILQVPIIALLCAFLFMISGQLLSMEETEISLLKSRGAARREIFNLYLMQSVLMATVGAAIALPLGILLCRMLGSANAFLSFGNRKNLYITMTWEVLFFALGAIVMSILVQVLPALWQSRLSIVAAKRKKHSNEKKWWQKFFVDFVLLAVGIYGYFSFQAQKEQMMLDVVEGSSLNPLLYFSSALFILGAGLVMLRVWPFLVKLIFSLGKKAWKPDKYASFLQVLRTGHKQLFMMEFIILTVALGIFYATVARTILFNAEQNTDYQLGTDLIISQQWKSNYWQFYYGSTQELIYKEADATGFAQLNGVKSMTRVLQGVAVNGTGASMNDSWGHRRDEVAPEIRYMGIVTDEFGKMVQDYNGNAYTLQQYLNVLSTNPEAVIVSKNYKDKLGMKIGDKVSFTYADSVATTWTKQFTGTIYGFFEEFPTYVAKRTIVNDEGEAQEVDNMLIVGNLSGFQKQIGIVPYQLWFDLKSGGEADVIDYIEKEKITVNEYESLDEHLERIYEDPLFQGTNGILTIGFIVILVLCSVGFLIYWVLSIRERELLFGVFRAMGMSKKGILSMLVNEQVLSTLICLAVGAGIGFGASWMFVPMLQMTYTAGSQVLVTPLVTWTSDLVELFSVIAVVIVTCMFVLAKIVFSMKITSALKLGED